MNQLSLPSSAVNQSETTDNTLTPDTQLFPAIDNIVCERQRLRLQFALFQLLLNGKLTATRLPVASKETKGSLDGSNLVRSQPKSPYHVLDVGCATAQWCTALAQERPEFNITGLDIDHIFLPARVPINMSLEIADVLKPWGRSEESVDFIHIRNMSAVIRNKDGWIHCLGEAWKSLKPGGQIEISEIRPRWWDWERHVEGSEESLEFSQDTNPKDENDNWVNKETHADRHGLALAWFEKMLSMLGAKQGFDLDPILKLTKVLYSVGFTKVVERTEVVPIGSWPKDRSLRRKGELYLEMLDEGGKKEEKKKTKDERG